MAQHALTSNDEPTLGIQDAVNHCNDKLSTLMYIVKNQRWQQLAPCIKDYEHAIATLKKIMQHKHEIPSNLLYQFQYISTQQRRVMRTIHQHMQQITDDISSLDQGLSKLQQASHAHVQQQQLLTTQK